MDAFKKNDEWHYAKNWNDPIELWGGDGRHSSGLYKIGVDLSYDVGDYSNYVLDNIVRVPSVTLDDIRFEGKEKVDWKKEGF